MAANLNPGDRGPSDAGYNDGEISDAHGEPHDTSGHGAGTHSRLHVDDPNTHARGLTSGRGEVDEPLAPPSAGDMSHLPGIPGLEGLGHLLQQPQPPPQHHQQVPHSAVDHMPRGPWEPPGHQQVQQPDWYQASLVRSRAAALAEHAP